MARYREALCRLCRRELDKLKPITDERLRLVFETLDQFLIEDSHRKKKIEYNFIEIKNELLQKGYSFLTLYYYLGHSNGGRPVDIGCCDSSHLES